MLASEARALLQVRRRERSKSKSPRALLQVRRGKRAEIRTAGERNTRHKDCENTEPDCKIDFFHILTFTLQANGQSLDCIQVDLRSSLRTPSF